MSNDKNECKIIYVEDLDIPYTIRCSMVEPMKFKKYDRAKKKEEFLKEKR